MKLNEKERAQLYETAQAYVASETEGAFRNEVLRSIEEQADADLYDRFYTSLAFGTAGLRGILGGGTNRINVFMVRKVSQGLADYIRSMVADGSVVIAYDSRNYSEIFAKAAALTLCANAITVYLYDVIHPVPMLSYAVRTVHATAGIVITASHNPAIYNGYKVYWSDGGQVTPPHDEGIAKAVSNVSAASIKNIDEKTARNTQLLRRVPKYIDESYYQMVIDSLRRKDVFERSPIHVAYTPLHGAGNVFMRTLLNRMGVFVSTVAEQEQPDGNFPTVSMPNPEDPQAMRLAIELAKEIKADIVLGTDPDADRLGIAIPLDETKQSYRLLSGNQIAVLLCDYLMTTWHEKKGSDSRIPIVAKSLVTTDLVREITERHGGECCDVLTGFKYIAGKIGDLEQDDRKFFLFGCEESFGYLTVSDIRDKDAISSALCAVEMICHYHTSHTSLQQRLDEIYRQYGYYTETVLSFTYEGSAGKERMKHIMADFRLKKPGDVFAGHTIEQVEDLLRTDIETGFPLSDVIILRFRGGQKMVVRPSGTEPKIKYYLFFKVPADQKETFQATLTDHIAQIKAEL